jgi:hypothetical protein
MRLTLVTISLDMTRRQRRMMAAAVGVLATCIAGVAFADVPHHFEQNQLLRASHLEENFGKLVEDIAGIDTRVAQSETALTDLDARVATAEGTIAEIQGQVFQKNGNNGTQSCDAWCAQTANGDPPETGTCVGALANGVGYRSCGDSTFNSNGVFCYCSKY